MEKTENYGIVYLLTNEAMPGLVKIGKTSRCDLNKRMKELFTTGVPLPFECVYACKVKLSHMDELEAALHAAFAPDRVNENREFFRISPSQPLPLLKLLHHLNEGEVTAEVAAEIASDLEDADKKAIVKSKKRNPPLDYFQMGLHAGDMLRYDKDNEITVEIATNKKVRYKGEIRSLTSITTDLLGAKWQVQPTPHWLAPDGRSLSELYAETFAPTEEE